MSDESKQTERSGGDGKGGAGPVSRRTTPLAARGEPMVWLTGASMALCVLMIVGLLGLTLVQGARAFWPQSIHTVTMRDGTVFYGIQVREESFRVGADERAEVDEIRGMSGQEWAFTRDGQPLRRLYRVGNRELGPSFRWVRLYEIERVEEDGANIALLEREDWGVWIGKPTAVIRQDLVPSSEADELVASSDGARVEREVVGRADNGEELVRVRTYLAEGVDVSWEAFSSLHPEARSRRAQIKSIEKVEVGRVNAGLERARLRLAQAEIDLERVRNPANDPVNAIAWWAGVLGLVCSVVGVVFASRHKKRVEKTGSGRVVARAIASVSAGASWVVLASSLLFVSLEYSQSVWSFGGGGDSHEARVASMEERVERIREQTTNRIAALEDEYAEIIERRDEIGDEDARFRVMFEEGEGRFAPIRQTELDEPLKISQVVRAVRGNDLELGGKLGVYFSRWWEYLSDEPRDANTAGGIFPVIFGDGAFDVAFECDGGSSRRCGGGVHP